MVYNRVMDKSFKVRTVITILMFVVALIGLYTFNGIPFKIIYDLFAIMAIIELVSFFKKKSSFGNIILAILEFGFVMYSMIFIAEVSVIDFWYIILGVPGYDIFAYLFGKMLGGKFIKKSRPFPKISKNKTWEGTILGLVASIAMVAILMFFRGRFQVDYFYLLCGPLALVGDLFESNLKRKFGVKDSGEIISRNKFFHKIEMLVGGNAGHGGYLDRIDSTAFATTVILILLTITS